MRPTRGKILVIRGGAIGDFILTLPVLSAIRDRFPDVGLELLAYPRVGQLALAGGLVDSTQPIDARPMASFFAKGGPLPAELAGYFAGFDLIISYLFDPDLVFQENVARCSKAQFLAGRHRPDENGSLHATETFLQPLVSLAIFDADPTPRLDPSVNLDASADATANSSAFSELHPKSGEPPIVDRRWIALHPGSGSERKNWPEDRWQAFLARLLAQTKLQFLLVGGEVEGDRLARMAAALPRERVEIAQSLPLTQLALLLRRCAGYVGHDSGISHLAAALGLRGMVLWGDTRQEIWRPRSEHIRLVSSPAGLPGLELEEVLTAFFEHLAPS